jgi:hypothetical protein
LRVRIVLAIAVAGSLVAACSAFGSAAEVVMCEAAGTLSTAKTLVEQAAAKDANGDKTGAQQLANEARSLAEQAHEALQEDTSADVKPTSAWQALLDADLHVGQAANALLPAYAGTYGFTGEELATASKDFQTAAATLPARCFMVTAPPGAG